MSLLRAATTLSPHTAAAVLALADAAKAHDGADALSEQTRLRVQHGGGAMRYYLLDESDPALPTRPATDTDPGPGPLVGFAAAEDGTAELVVAPSHRGRGHGERLLRSVLHDEPAVGVWSHGGHPAARALAARHGLQQVRDLRILRMRLGEAAQGLGEPVLPRGRGVRVRTFRPGGDEAEVLAVNRRAFADHPEQGGMTLDDLLQREAEPWFDPAGFFVAVDEHDRIVAFHWTKVHDDGAGLADEPVGEVYVVGVDPDWQGTGLGRALTLRGVRHLRDRGLPWVLLYVEGDNAAAVHVYENAGFTLWRNDILYAADPAAGS